MVDSLLVSKYGRGFGAIIPEPVEKNWSRVRALFHLRKDIEESFHEDLKGLAVFATTEQEGDTESIQQHKTGGQE